MKTSSALRRLAEGGMIAAMYAALTLALAPVSYGLIQFRAAEILTILPVFTPAAIPGLAVGCVIANLYGLTIGANPAGAWDILFGSLATLAAAWLTYRLRNVKFKGMPVMATLMPVIFNAVVVGLELTILMYSFSWPAYLLCALYVAVGELLASTVCGLLFYGLLIRSGASKMLFKG